MNKAKRFLAPLLAMLLVLTPFSGVIGANGADNENTNGPALEATVTPTNDTIVMPANGLAEGNLDINVKPTGILKDDGRDPIEVVFVMDTSGSMNESAGKVRVEKEKCVKWGLIFCKKWEKYYQEVPGKTSKLDAAELALNNVIEEVFAKNKLEDDRYSLVSFGSDIKTGSTLDLTDNLTSITNKVNGLRADGGTNYTQALKKAKDILASAKPNSKKYIVFLTDGIPTHSYYKESVTADFKVGETCFIWCSDKLDTKTVTTDVEYEIWQRNGNDYVEVQKYKDAQWKNEITWRSLHYSLDTVRTKIKNHINQEVQNLKNNNVEIYSIGFGNDSEVDMNYLNSISSKAERGDSQNLSSIFNMFGKEISEASLKEAKLKVKLPENVTATGENGYAMIEIAENVPFMPNEAAPELETSDFDLPLQFSKAGEYIFDDIQLIYKDVNGKDKTIEYPEEIKITVVESVTAQFTGTVSYEDPDKVGALEKIGTENSDSNQFNVIYDIVPFGGTGSGKFENITIKQPLPSGITLKNEVITDKYTAKQISEESSNFVEITYPNMAVTYRNIPINYNKMNGAEFQDSTNCVKVKTDPWKIQLTKNHCGFQTNDVVQVTYKEGNGTKTITINEAENSDQDVPGEPILVQVLSGMPDINVQIPLQADYAVETSLPAAEVIFDHTSYYDDSLQQDLKSTLAAPEETIKMVVKLYGSSHTFIGDHNGGFDVKDNSGKDVPIKITNEAGVEIAQPAYAVKSMEFVEGKNEKQVKVTYFNDEIAYINLNIVNLEFNEKVYIIQGKEQLSLYDFKPQDPGDAAPYSSASDFTWQIVSGDTSLIDGIISADGKIKGKQVSDDESDYVTVRATLKTDSSVSAETKVYVSSGLSNIDFAESNYKIEKDDNEQLSLSGLENAIINGDVTAESSSPSIVDITTSTNNYIDVNGKGAGVSTVKAKAKGTEVIVNATGNVSISDNKEVSDTTIVTVTLELPKPDKSKEKEW